MSIRWPTTPGPTPRRHEPVEPIQIRFLANGTGSRVKPLQAAYFVVTGQAEVVGELDPRQQAAFDAGITHHRITQEERTRP